MVLMSTHTLLSHHHCGFRALPVMPTSFILFQILLCSQIETGGGSKQLSSLHDNWGHDMMAFPWEPRHLRHIATLMWGCVHSQLIHNQIWEEMGILFPDHFHYFLAVLHQLALFQSKMNPAQHIFQISQKTNTIALTILSTSIEQNSITLAPFLAELARVAMLIIFPLTHTVSAET